MGWQSYIIGYNTDEEKKRIIKIIYNHNHPREFKNNNENTENENRINTLFNLQKNLEQCLEFTLTYNQDPTFNKLFIRDWFLKFKSI